MEINKATIVDMWIGIPSPNPPKSEIDLFESLGIEYNKNIVNIDNNIYIKVRNSDGSCIFINVPRGLERELLEFQQINS